LKNRGLSLGIVQKDIQLDVTIMIMTIPIILNQMLWEWLKLDCISSSS
jgi:hypothetical protein